MNLLPIETLKEMANDTAEQVENNAKATVQKAIDCGRYLTAIREQCEPGKWLEWLGANWNYSQPTASRYIAIADGYSRVNNVRDAKSIREALRMIADDRDEKTAPRSERKPADVVVSIPDDSTRVLDDPGEPDAGEVDDDPTPDPPSNRKTASGSEKVSEDKKPRTQTVVPEILDDEPSLEVRDDSEVIEEWLRNTGFIDVVTEALEKKPEFEAKKAAKVLRKLADKLDPPTKFVKPDLDDVTEYFSEMNAIDPESFFDFYESKGWLVGKVSMKNWQASARKWIRENAANGKGNGNGYRQSGNRNGSAERTAEDIFG